MDNPTLNVSSDAVSRGLSNILRGRTPTEPTHFSTSEILFWALKHDFLTKLVKIIPTNSLFQSESLVF